jgi:hypothetical protein
MQIFALTPHFWSSSHVHNPDTLLDCLPQAEVDKNHSPGPPDYRLFQKISRAGRDLLYFSTDPRHFQPVLLYKWPEVGVMAIDLLYGRPSAKVVTGGLSDRE